MTGWLTRDRLNRALLGLAAPLLAIAASLVLTSLVLLLGGYSPSKTISVMLEAADRPRTQTQVLNSATLYYLSAVAVAIGFRMNLFNIGVDGQYRLAALIAAAVGGAISLPAPLHVFVTLLTAVLVGAMWAGVAAVLKVTRGVSEVISTIMLNFIATGLIAWLLNVDRLAVPVAGSNNIGTEPIPPSGQVPGISLISGSSLKVYGLVILAIAVGIGYHVFLGRTRIGFDLRATGLSEQAAVASGVNVKRMVLLAMLLSGAVAGLVGMPELLGASFSYALNFPAGLGFTGIAIALLGRNRALGMAFAAVFWGFLDSAGNALDINRIPKEIVIILQGSIVLAVVIAYELVRRYRIAAEQRRVSSELETAPAAEEVSV
ncbi:MAG TPA: ABC transporter permease [Actinomycetes bacterium]|nr:ABC transporter permease [Actinomycetes bacterium]